MARRGDRRTLAEQLGRILSRDATFAVSEPVTCLWRIRMVASLWHVLMPDLMRNNLKQK